MLLAESVLIYPVKKTNSIDYYRVYAFNFFPEKALHPATTEGGWIVLDSHTDAIPMSMMAGMIHYDIDTNPDTVYDRHDPFLYHRKDSYNASSFLYYLLAEEILKLQNLYLIGVSDYPPKHAFRIKDPRIESYVNVFSELKRKGVTILTKNDFLVSPSKIRNILTSIKTPYVYISVDLDIGARNGVEGVRFLERQGLNERQIYRILGFLRSLLSRGVRLAGMDLTEINPPPSRWPSPDRRGSNLSDCSKCHQKAFMGKRIDYH